MSQLMNVTHVVGSSSYHFGLLLTNLHEKLAYDDFRAQVATYGF